jgi:hypothetical protein
MKRNNLLIVSMVAVLMCSGFSQTREEFGDTPAIPNSDWPEGTITAVESPGRIYSVCINGDERFYFHGDTKELNLFLGKFAAIDMPTHRLMLEKRFNQVSSLNGGMSMRYDWLLKVPSGIYLDKLIRDKGSDSNEVYPSLLVLPENVKVVLPDGKPVNLQELRVTEPAMKHPSGRISTTVRNKNLELCSEAQTVLADFYDALNKGKKLKALLLCSKNVQTKAAEYDSAKDFFTDVVPVKDLIQNYPPDMRGLSKHSGHIVRYNFETRLVVPDLEHHFRWPWSIILESKDWVVDFETKPLNIWLKHANMEYKALNEGFRQDQQKLKQSLRISLIPHDENFVIGQPILFDIEMQNIGDETVMYGRTSWMVNNPMLITDSNGATVPYIDTSYQTIVGLEFIEPNQTIKLVKDYDVTSQYHIVKPGRYTFQFIGFRPEVPSNIIEREVKPGRLSNLDIITEKLLAVLPSRWSLTRSRRPQKGDDVESDTPYTVVHMIGERGTKGKSRGIELILFVDLPSDDRVTKEWKDEGLQYWGKSRLGPIYVVSFDAEQLWPTYRQDIQSALGIE